MAKEKHINKFRKVLVILGIIILPVIYSYFYLNGFWNPYNKLDEIPVALVNLDECEENCKSTELVNRILKTKSFDFQIVNENQADKGLVNKKYFSVIKIPKNFTKQINSIEDGSREEIKIYYSPNLKTNYLVAQFTNTAVKQIVSELKLNISTNVIEELTKNIQNTFAQTNQIKSGLGTIEVGSYQLNSGLTELNNGINTLYNKYGELNTGINQIYQGSKELSAGVNKIQISVKESINTTLTDTQIQQIKNNAKTTADLTNANKIDITNGINTNLDNQIKPIDIAINAMTNVLSGSSYTATTMLTETNNCNQTTIQNLITTKGIDTYSLAIKACTAYQTANTTSTQVLISLKANMPDSVISVATIATKNSAYETAGLVATNIKTNLMPNLQNLSNGLIKLNSGVNELNSGLNNIEKGSNEAYSGINDLNKGSSKLTNGSNSLYKGTKTSKEAISQKIEEKQSSIEKLTSLPEYTKSSVKIQQDDYGNVKEYGTFFSPYFMSLSLWVGGLLILMGLYYDPDSRFKILGRETSNRQKRLLYYNIIGVCQAIILAFILKLCLGFEVTNIWLFYVSCILISEAFLSIILFLFFNFKDIGKFLALVFLVLQLAACGGTFPVQVEPTLYQVVYPFMPMTYSVDLLRESFVSINSSFLIKDTCILVGILIVFTTITLITSLIKNRK